MLAAVPAMAGLVLGILAGLYVAPARRWCSTCGRQRGCQHCQEVNSGAPSSAK